MIDLRPVGYVIGLLVAVLGSTMLIPLAVDLWTGNDNWFVFLEGAILTVLTGALLAMSSVSGMSGRLTLQQTFLMTTGVWLVLPIFGALPFYIGGPEMRAVDAFFEAMSGLTTTGSTVIVGLDDMQPGVLVWRSMLQWFGGVGIIVVAMVFLPELRVGGMQIFRSESFDTGGKVLPRAAQIAARIIVIYVGLTAVCHVCYVLVGMSPFDAFNHAMTTVATGGFSTTDASFGAFPGAAEIVATVFMILASLPFVRYVQILAGQPGAILHDSQVRAFLVTFVIIVVMLVAFNLVANGASFGIALRQVLFNGASILTGTGYASTDYQLWGAFPVTVFFLIGLIGGCAGSTCCSIKVFRFQLLFASVRAQLQRIHSPHGVFTPHYEGRRVSDDVLSSVMAFFLMFVVSLGVLAVALSMTGLDFVTSISGAATALANIGPGLGDTIGPAGSFAPLNDTAKWLLSAAMLIGRLELLAVYALLTVSFWRG
ncbi:potassium transporter TrkH [Actibacterium mucosum KCTC 23349]|uniref:Trk system potassium uptake protein n=1 Tax=Actibacterium mucosum KCTC 23349 TaxID=1454373 RepID=A0A037ZF19_9RHOB|nr:TrkH family potassium uptake protein [Actibacterium mucosum]KAJ54208.1 potassium transporter TrkH [Actibacterium mucosum KCTC 23349]